MRVRTDIVVPEGLELLGTEMIEEQERPHGLPFRGGKQAANLEGPHRAHSRLQYQDVSHYFKRRSSAQPSGRSPNSLISLPCCNAAMKSAPSGSITSFFDGTQAFDAGSSKVGAFTSAPRRD